MEAKKSRVQMQDKEKIDQTHLLPPYLDFGSEGPAVLVIQVWLRGVLGHLGKILRVPINGLYDELTAEAVQVLQRERLGFTGKDIDGNFGPKTRKAIKEDIGIDFDEISFGCLLGRTLWRGPRHKGLKTWPPSQFFKAG